MVNYVTKSISIFSTICFIVLVSCQNDNSGSLPINTTSPTADVIVPSVVDMVTLCPVGMVYIKNGNFCIDQYEWPNQKGSFPDYAMTAYKAEALCKGIGKRLCTDTEWEIACRGSSNTNYGYGNNYVPNTCNDSITTNYIPVDWSRMDDPIKWKIYAGALYKGVQSGSKAACFSPEGDNKVYDMIGNVREWVTDPSGYGGYAFESSFWYGTLSGPLGCGFVIRSHSPGFASYEVGTRCCENAQ